MKAAGKAFTLATSILQASVVRRLACLKRSLVITLACCCRLRGDLYISGVEAFWTSRKLQVAKGKAVPVAFFLETSNHLMKHGAIQARCDRSMSGLWRSISGSPS